MSIVVLLQQFSLCSSMSINHADIDLKADIVKRQNLKGRIHAYVSTEMNRIYVTISMLEMILREDLDVLK